MLHWPTWVSIQSLQTLRHNGYLSPTQPGLVSCNLTFDLQKSSEQKLEKGQLSNQATLFANRKLCSQSQMLQHVTYKWLPLDPLVKLKSLTQWIIVNHWVNSDSFQGPQWTWTLLLYIHVLAPSTSQDDLVSQIFIARPTSAEVDLVCETTDAWFSTCSDLHFSVLPLAFSLSTVRAAESLTGP